MDMGKIGQYIARERKARNMTQADLAEKLGVSNKSVSKWETGKCLPGYSVVAPLCHELNITANELLNGETCAEGQFKGMADAQALKTIERIERLEKDKSVLSGLALLLLGIALLALSQTTGGSPVQDLASGIMLGLAIASIFAGVYVAGRQYVK